MNIQTINSAIPVARKALYGTMIAGAMTIGTSKLAANNTPVSNPTMTEAQAPQNSNNSGVAPYSYNHNKKIDNKLLSFAEDEQERKMIQQYIDKLYSAGGAYAGAVSVQRSVTENALLKFLESRMTDDIKIELIYSEEAGLPSAALYVKFENEDIEKWEDDFIKRTYDVLNRKMSVESGTISAKKCSDALDDYAKTSLSEIVDFDKYNKEVQAFIKQQNAKSNLNEVQRWSDLAAFKIFVLDRMCFEKYLDKKGVFVDSTIVPHKYSVKREDFLRYMNQYKPTP